MVWETNNDDECAKAGLLATQLAENLRSFSCDSTLERSCGARNVDLADG